MFRSLFQDHLQGLSFALSAPTTLQLHASSFFCIGMWSYALYLYVYPVYLLVCYLVVIRPEWTQAGTPDTHTNRGHTTTYQYRKMTKRAAEACRCTKSEGRPLKMVLE
jgi:hypothetical protein